MDQNQPTNWLLDCLAMGTLDEKTAPLGRLSDSDWSQVFDVAMRHGVVPLLYDRLKPLASRCNVPAAVTQKLYTVYLANAARNIKLYHELAQVLTALQKQDIPVVVLKGAHLAELIYGNIALRTMYDLDLLIRNDDLARAAAMLQELGYGTISHDYDLAHQYQLRPFIRSGSTPIEIHWTIAVPTQPASIETDGLWNRSRSAVVTGIKTRVLSPEDLLLHLCSHACGHEFDQKLRPFCDMAAVLMHYQREMDWKLVGVRAQQWKAQKSVHLSLLLLQELLGAPVPEQLLASLKPNNFDAKWEALAREQIYSMDDTAPKEQVPFWNRKEYGSWKMAVILKPKAVLSKLRALLKVVFPSPTYMRGIYKLPRRSMRVYFYYPVRLWYLVRKYLTIAWRLVRPEKKPPLPDADRFWRRSELRKWLRE